MPGPEISAPLARSRVRGGFHSSSNPQLHSCRLQVSVQRYGCGGNPPYHAPQPQGMTVNSASSTWHRIGLVGVLLLSAFLNLYRLDREGNGNQYYTADRLQHAPELAHLLLRLVRPGRLRHGRQAAARLLDSGGQREAARLFGFGYSGLSVLLPEALAGVASVAILYLLVRRASARSPACWRRWRWR